MFCPIVATVQNTAANPFPSNPKSRNKLKMKLIAVNL